MPLTPEEEKALVEKIATQLSGSLNGIITPLIEPIASKVTGFEKNLSGQIARIAGETVKSLIPAGQGAGDQSGTGGDKDKSKREEIDTIKKQNEALAKQHEDLVLKLQRKEDESAVRAALAKKGWIDPEEPVPVLLGQVKRKGDGKLFVPGKKMVGNVEMDDIELTLDEAVDKLATQKTHWLKSSLKGGTGASGGNSSSANVSADDAERMSFSELRRSTSVPQMILEGKSDLLTQKARADLAKGPQTAPARGRIPARLAQAIQKHNGA